MFSGGTQQYHPHIAVGRKLLRDVAQFVQCLCIQAVQFVWPIQGQAGDARLDGEESVVVIPHHVYQERKLGR